VRVNFTLGEARTLAPQAELSVFDHFEYRFAKDGGAEAARTPQDGVFVLDTGAYTLKVNAYMSAGTDKLAASGTASFTVSAGANASVSLALQPVASGGGTGTFKYALVFPAWAVVEDLSLTRIGGGEAVDLKAGAVTTTTSLNGEKNVGMGYYLFMVSLSLTKTDGIHIQRRTEVVHIYQNMTAEARATDYTFAEQDFEGDIYVTNAADSGAGSLRDALGKAAIGATIQIDLPAGSVITLASRLEISKNLGIQGNGVTLTGASNSTLQLLYVNSGVTASIGRIHFKNGSGHYYDEGHHYDGGGAVNNDGNLTLESCIFSENRVAFGNGGAVLSSGNLTVRGCTFYNNSVTYAHGGAIAGATITLSGNLFYGNKAHSYSDGHVVYGGVTSTGYNVADRPKGTGSGQSGFDHADDRYSNALPLAPLNFKVLSGGGAHGIITTLPDDYPAVDFYGQPISAGASAGAVQAVADGYPVFTSKNNGYGSISIAETLNEDGLYTGSVSLTAAGTNGYILGRWLVNGVESFAANPLVLTLTGPVDVHAEFNRLVTVTSAADSGAGTLREALANAGNGDIITMGTANQTIELASRLAISKDIVIQGNGLTLTRATSWTTVSNTSQLLHVEYPVTASISRVHFKDGRTAGDGGAVLNEGYLTLESCIFSGNQTTGSNARVGAVCTQGNLTVRGCTFYNNSSAGTGGAISNYLANGTITLSGNLFYGNTADRSRHVVAGEVTSTGYNVSDRPKGTGSGQSGFDHADDGYSIAPLFAPLSFKVLSGSGAHGIITTLPADYPTVDFYGQPISAGASAGAVQAVAAAGYAVHTSTNNSNGSVSIAGTPNADGLYTGAVSLTAVLPAGGYTLRWLVNGVDSGAANPLPLTLTGPVTVLAEFSRLVSSNANSGTGTLRAALANAVAGDIIRIGTANQTIALESPLTISKDIVIQGNGLTLVSESSNLLYVNSGVTASIGRVHFKDGRTANNGGAISNTGFLTLESCIFSGNQITASNAYGGAVSTSGSLIVRGCTFYNNSSAGYGGAIYRGGIGTTILSGNLFYGNTAASDSQGHVVYGSVSSTGYNVADRPKGSSSSGGSGFDHANDSSFADIGINGDPLNASTFAPVSGLGSFIPSAPPDFPLVDFYGETRTWPGAPGAVK
jgi:hypothetical protein